MDSYTPSKSSTEQDGFAERSAHWNLSGQMSPFVSSSEPKDLKSQLIEQEQQKLQHAQRFRNSSIVGPSDPKLRRNFLISLSIMLVCGSGNDFFAKTIYQILPGYDSGLKGLKNDYWATVGLTAAAFFVCSFALINGRGSFKQLTWKSLSKIMIPAFMDLFVTGGRYLALVFLPAAVVSILKNGLQLFFLSLIRAFFRGKKFGRHQWYGLGILFVGLIIVSGHDLIDATNSDNDYTVLDSLFGVLLMVFVGFAGAVRNTIEEMLLKDYDFHSGMESIFSLIAVLITGLIILIIDETTGWNDIIPGVWDALRIVGLTICLCLFMFSIYGKDTMQMKVTKLSSAMTRKLFQQLYPINTWILSIIIYCIDNRYGEDWDQYSFLQLFGFIVVLYGTYIYYMQPRYFMPKKMRIWFNLEEPKQESLIENDSMGQAASVSGNIQTSNET